MSTSSKGPYKTLFLQKELLPKSKSASFRPESHGPNARVLITLGEVESLQPLHSSPEPSPLPPPLLKVKIFDMQPTWLKEIRYQRRVRVVRQDDTPPNQQPTTFPPDVSGWKKMPNYNWPTHNWPRIKNWPRFKKAVVMEEEEEIDPSTTSTTGPAPEVSPPPPPPTPTLSSLFLNGKGDLTSK